MPSLSARISSPSLASRTKLLQRSSKAIHSCNFCTLLQRHACHACLASQRVDPLREKCHPIPVSDSQHTTRCSTYVSGHHVHELVHAHVLFVLSSCVVCQWRFGISFHSVSVVSYAMAAPVSAGSPEHSADPASSTTAGQCEPDIMLSNGGNNAENDDEHEANISRRQETPTAAAEHKAAPALPTHSADSPRAVIQQQLPHSSVIDFNERHEPPDGRIVEKFHYAVQSQEGLLGRSSCHLPCFFSRCTEYNGGGGTSQRYITVPG